MYWFIMLHINILACHLLNILNVTHFQLYKNENYSIKPLKLRKKMNWENSSCIIGKDLLSKFK